MLGIDLRVTSVKVVEAVKQDSGFVIQTWGMTEVPYQLLDKHPQIEEAKADALRKIVQFNKMKSNDAIVVVGGAETFVKLFTLSEMPRSEAIQAIKWKFAEEIPFPIDEALFDFYALPKGNAVTEKADYVAACISKKLFNETQMIIKMAGLNLAGITVLPEALQELYKEELSRGGEKIISIIYMGKRTTNISLYRSGNFEFNRELSIGGENITLAMSGILITPEGKVEITPEQAEKIKTEHGIPINLENYPNLGEIPLPQLQAMVRPALEKIQTEISRTFEYYKGQTGEAAVNKIILTGGSALTPNLREFLSEGLGIPVVMPEVVPKLHPRLSATLGAALADPRRLNLLPEEIKHRWRIIAKKLVNRSILVPLFFGLLGAAYLLFWLQSFNLQTELKNIQAKLEQYKPRLAQLEAIQQASQEDERRRLSIKNIKQKNVKLPRVLEQISHYIPASAFLTSLTLTPDELHLWGTVFTANDTAENILSRYVLSLTTSLIFAEVRLIQAAKNDEYTTEALNFELIAKVKE